jgi:hypothetical protein
VTLEFALAFRPATQLAALGFPGERVLANGATGSIEPVEATRTAECAIGIVSRALELAAAFWIATPVTDLIGKEGTVSSHGVNSIARQRWMKIGRAAVTGRPFRYSGRPIVGGVEIL